MNLEMVDPAAYAALMAAANGREIEYLGHGSCRAVYRVKGRNLVLKVQYGSYAPDANKAEATLWSICAKHPEARKRLAPCRLLDNGVLVMRAVEKRHGPQWSWSVDGGQGGLYKDRWVLYDYGHELFRYEDDIPGRENFRAKPWFREAG